MPTAAGSGAAIGAGVAGVSNMRMKSSASGATGVGADGWRTTGTIIRMVGAGGGVWNISGTTTGGAGSTGGPAVGADVCALAAGTFHMPRLTF